MLDLPRGIARAADPGERTVFDLTGPAGRVRVSRLGAHVQHWWLPADGGGGDDVLFTSRDASYAPATATRGGVPVVFPWFGAHGSRTDLPAHGFARIMEWELVAAEPDAAVTLRLEDDETTRAAWPHRFRADYTVDVRGPGLALELSVENRGDELMRFEEALHTYFAVGAVQTATVHGLEGVPFTEHAKAPEEATDSDAPIVFRAETDRVFQGVPPRHELRCPDLGRSIVLDTGHSASTIVWNPWIAKAAAMGQMADDEWREFVCVESANVKEGAIELAPGARHAMSLRLTVGR